MVSTGFNSLLNRLKTQDSPAIILVLLVYISIFVLSVILSFAMMHWFNSLFWRLLHSLIMNLFLFGCLSSHYQTMTSDPGIVNVAPLSSQVVDSRMEEEENNIMDNLEHYGNSQIENFKMEEEENNIMDNFRYCGMCEHFIPTIANHCMICKKCIILMNHHCPWMNNCIGYKNLKSFLLFLFYVILTVIYILVLNLTFHLDCLQKTCWITPIHLQYICAFSSISGSLSLAMLIITLISIAVDPALNQLVPPPKPFYSTKEILLHRLGYLFGGNAMLWRWWIPTQPSFNNDIQLSFNQDSIPQEDS